MLVTHIEVPRPLTVDFIKNMMDDLGSLDTESARIFYNYYCKSRFPYEEKDFNLNEIEEKEIYMLDDRDGILIKRYLHNLFVEGLEKIFYPLTFLKNGADLGEDIFCISLEDKFIIGCAENMRYVNRVVYHRNHLIVMLIKMICKI